MNLLKKSNLHINRSFFRFDASAESNTKRGVSSEIGKTFKLSLDLRGTSWKKVPESVKKFYWDEFKVYVDYIQSIQMELDIIRKVNYIFFVV